MLSGEGESALKFENKLIIKEIKEGSSTGGSAITFSQQQRGSQPHNVKFEPSEPSRTQESVLRPSKEFKLGQRTQRDSNNRKSQFFSPITKSISSQKKENRKQTNPTPKQISKIDNTAMVY
jgi:hypothetical protein